MARAQAEPLRSSQRRVAVIGAGMSGLTAAKCLLDEGIKPVVFEQATTIGGLWNYDEELPDGGSVMYRSVRTNTSTRIMAFSDFPFPEALPDFPHRSDVLTYLHDYAHHFGLHEYIRLGTEVETVTPTGSGQWEILLRTGGVSTTEMFDAVVVCSGRDRCPWTPSYPGIETYQRTLLHSSSYKGPESYAGQDIVVVGAGNSGADIAVELSEVAHQVFLSTTSGAWFIPRYIGTQPFDHRLTRLGAYLPYRLRIRFFRSLLLSEYKRMGITRPLSSWGMPNPTFDLWRARLTPNAELLPRLVTGTIKARPSIARLEATDVVFEDSSRIPADAIISCTGYTLNFPFFDASLVEVKRTGMDLYKHVFHPDLPNLAFIGFCSVAGPLLPVSEMQARWVARVLTGTITLPSSAHMHDEINQHRTHPSQQSPYPMRVQLQEYLDEIGKIIGVRPNLPRHPTLLLPLLLGPFTAAQYRLDGPGSWKPAETIIRKSKTRDT